MKIVYGTTNRAKLQAMRKAVKSLGLDILGLADMKCKIPTVQECGNTPLENAEIKAKAYYKAFQMPVFSCDSGLYFDELPQEEQPGIWVRRINGKVLTDDEMITYYSALARRYGGKITGRYRNAICFVPDENHCYASMDESIATEPFILSAVPHPKRVDGFPLDSLSIDMTTGRYYYDLDTKDVSSSVEEGVKIFFQEVLSKLEKDDFGR